METNKKIKVAISVGDINGIGIEIILKTLQDKMILDFFTPIIFASTKILSYQKNRYDLPNLNFYGIQSADKALDRKINVVNLWKDTIDFDFGKSTPLGGKLAFESLNAAANAVKNGEADVLVTAPINKKNIQSDEFNFPGHTEYLGKVWGGKPLMFLISEKLKVGLVSQHIPIQEVANKVTEKNITEKINAITQSLKLDFGITKPKIAVMGLNPHAGDDGLLGKEEKEIIAPAVKKNNDQGKLVFGPYASDSFFVPQNISEFDAVLAMYHDQGLIPFKTISFGEGVNYTASLPFVRTSPDHGVAYDIAGENLANESSFKEAIYAAISIYRKREEYKELTQNVLKTKKIRLEK